MIDLILANAVIRDIKDFDIRLGQTFTLDASNIEEEVTFFSSNDPVLSIIQQGNSVKIKAVNEGQSTLLIQSKDRSYPSININVFQARASLIEVVELRVGFKSEL